MHVVKWLRKNNRKIMVVVIFIAIIGFVGGSYLQKFQHRKTQGLHDAVAYFGADREITRYDFSLARQELEILRALQTDTLLQNIGISGRDLHAAFLAEILFSDRTTSPMMVNYLKRMIRTNQYSISDRQINDIYKASMPPYIYWLLLKNEATQAGIETSNKSVAQLLGNLIPQLSGQPYERQVGRIVSQYGIPEERILTIFGELLSVFEYSKILSSSENMTISQIKHALSWENENIDVEFVQFNSAVFAKGQPEPSAQQLEEHFEKYKSELPGSISDDNPYGFGYKQPDRVQLEYIAVKFDDISKTVAPTTAQQAEDYYQKNSSQFTVEIPLDANDPNSEKIERIKDYAEVAATISEQLYSNRINLETERILQEAVSLMELNFAEMEPNLTAELLKEKAGNYETVAAQLAKKYKVPVYSGKTGMLTASDIRADEKMKTLYVGGQGYGNAIELSRIVFAVEPLASSELGRYDIEKPRMYENIGLLKDTTKEILAVIRVIETRKTSDAESLEQTFSTRTLVLNNAGKDSDKNVYSVKEKVTEDLKKLSAMKTASQKAKEFKRQIVEDGWDEAIDKFNKKYVEKADDDIKEFELRDLPNVLRTSPVALKTLAIYSAGDPEEQFATNFSKKESILKNKFYSLVPEDKDTLENVPAILEFKGDMSYYVIKSISIKRFDREQYENLKAQQGYKENVVRANSLAPIHFNPGNILERMKFKSIEDDE